MSKADRKIQIITGPTATGKTARGIELALQARDVEIINADSLLVYRGMDIGTAKPSLEERASVPHHLIDIRDPNEAFSAGDFVKLAESTIREVQSRGRWPMIVGGTGFYLKALMHGLWEAPPTNLQLRQVLEAQPNSELFGALRQVDPRAAERIGAEDRYRLVRALEIYQQSGKTPSQLEAEQRKEPDTRFELTLLDVTDPSELEKRIRQRTQRMLEQGLIAETESLIKKWGDQVRPLESVGYAQVVDYLLGKAPQGRSMAPGLAGLEDEIVLATRQLVKRQRTWLRGQIKS